MQNYVRHHI